MLHIDSSLTLSFQLHQTATHIHQAAKGAAGPPRIAFPNPEKVGQTSSGAELRRSSGCAQGPFVTGLNAANTTTDTGSASGFKLADIEKDGGAGFFADVHTKQVSTVSRP